VGTMVLAAKVAHVAPVNSIGSGQVNVAFHIGTRSLRPRNRSTKCSTRSGTASPRHATC